LPCGSRIACKSRIGPSFSSSTAILSLIWSSERSLNRKGSLASTPTATAASLGLWYAAAPSAVSLASTALTGVVHDRQSAAGPEHSHGRDNQQGGLHGDLANAGPRLTPVLRIIAAQMNPTNACPALPPAGLARAFRKRKATPPGRAGRKTHQRASVDFMLT